MRLAPILALLAVPAQAWEFTPTPVCTLTHATPEASLAVTYDPRLPEPYALTISLAAAWPDAPSFAIRYDGARPLSIATDRHVLSNGGRTLTVTDRGFGNVLDGFEFGTTATALSGQAAVAFDLTGAAGPVAQFRACTDAPSV